MSGECTVLMKECNELQQGAYWVTRGNVMSYKRLWTALRGTFIIRFEPSVRLVSFYRD